MSNRFFDPFPQFASSSAVYAGGSLTFYESGTSTPLDTYSDTSGTLNSNPITLNSAGRPSVAIFLQDAAYKVVLKDSDGNTIWTADPVYTSDYSGPAQFSVYAGNPNGNVAGTAGSGSVKADAIWDTTNSILYVCTTTGSASTAVWTAVNASTAAAVVVFPQGRLTLTSGTPVTTSDVTSATAVYYTPYLGNIVPIYNGASFTQFSFSELTLSLVSSHAANSNYDIFAFSNSGVVTIGTGPAWSSATSRGTGAGTTEIARVNGISVNNVSITLRNGSTTYSVSANQATYLGTMRTTSSNGQTTDDAGGRFLWNAYNRRPRTMYLLASTSTWNYSTATFRQAGGLSGNQLSMVIGLSEDEVTAFVCAEAVNSTSTIRFVAVGIGLDSTSASSATKNLVDSCSDSKLANPSAEYRGYPGVGYHILVWLEMGNGTDTQTWSGDLGQASVGSQTQTGISGTIFA